VVLGNDWFQSLAHDERILRALTTSIRIREEEEEGGRGDQAVSESESMLLCLRVGNQEGERKEGSGEEDLRLPRAR
jgi:hypothetical protein